MLSSRLQAKTLQHRESSLWREQYVIDDKKNNVIEINGKTLINFSSSDYLNLSDRSEILKAATQGIEKYGLGSTASAHVCGYSKSHQLLEQQFAEFLNRDSAILFNCGYLANLAVIQVLADKNTAIFSDKLCHASMIDAIQLSGANNYRFKHHDLAHLKLRLQKYDAAEKLILTESIFSMEGDITDIKPVADLALQTNSTLIVDDAHAVGVLGAHGGGICEYLGLTQKEVPVLITPLGKAFAACGAVVSGSGEFIDLLRQFARSYMYTTAMPPAIAHALATTLKIIQQAQTQRTQLTHLIHFFNDAAKQRNLNIHSRAITPIRAIITGADKTAVDIQEFLFNQGFFVGAIRRPTVPENTARLRISLNYLHTEKQIVDLLDIVENFYATRSISRKTEN